MTETPFWSSVSDSMKTFARREDVRDAILDATNRLLARYGYRKMTMDDLAREVGIGKGTLYLYFKSKEEIALSHIDHIVERLKENLLAIARENAPPGERLREMLITRVLFRFDSVQHYTESLNELLAELRPQLLARRRRYFDEEAQVFAEVIEKGQGLHLFESGDPHEIAHLLLTATNSLLPYSLSTQELGERAELNQKVSQLADLLLAGVLRRNKGKKKE
jgi:AcrR family transcriptional regulator